MPPIIGPGAVTDPTTRPGTVIDAVCARLAAAVPSRQVFGYGVPDAAPERYLLVTSNDGAGSDDFAQSNALRLHTVWVTSVSTGERSAAAREAAWAARASLEALVGWTPDIGSLAWPGMWVAGQPAGRDESLPSSSVFYAVNQFDFQFQK